MYLLRPAVFTLLSLLSIRQSYANVFDEVPKQQHTYQSDVARMRQIVINSLYSHREVFLRELLSNANDALEKLRLISLTNKDVHDSSHPLNVTIKVQKGKDGKPGRIIITDTGIGMSPDELTTNLGTLAKSGTSEFVAKAESGGDASNLIGAFGLGFYSSFLVADQVHVASIPPKSAKNPEPQQYIFSSKSTESSFNIFPDPRGNTLGGHGTEVTLELKEDASVFLDTDKIQKLVAKHSSFSTTYPIWLLTYDKEVIIEDEEIEDNFSSVPPKPSATSTATDEEGAVVEDEKKPEDDIILPKTKVPKTREVLKDKWIQLNAQAPIWMRDPKEVTDEEYIEFFKATFKEPHNPLAWQHFQGDASGVHFKALFYIPAHIKDEFWNNPKANLKDIRLMVKRVFITNDLGSDGLAKWASWIKVIVDADDLPLNVSRETLQSNKFLKQIKQILVKRLLQLLAKIAEEDEKKYKDVIKTYGNAIKLGAVEDKKNQRKIAALARFHTSTRDFASLDQIVNDRKEGQKQIFHLGAIGQKPEMVKKSIFIEKLIARGYEVLLLIDPLDDFLFTSLSDWKGFKFQDAAKKGLLFGDENEEAEKEREARLTTEFEPLIKYFKAELGDSVKEVVISNRLVESPCAIVAAKHGYSANMERIMSAQNKKEYTETIYEMVKKERFLEINPDSPLIEGLLRRVKELPEDPKERDEETVQELNEVTSILIDGARIRSGFDVSDPYLFFSRVDRVLRRSLGVSEHAKPDVTVAPAPPKSTEIVESEPEEGSAKVAATDSSEDATVEDAHDDDEELPLHDEL